MAFTDRRLLLTLGVALALIASALALRAAIDASRSTHGASVDTVVIGDSLTAQAAGDLMSAGLLRGLAVTADGVAGKTFEDRIATVQQLAATRPPVVVVELGTNDVLQRLPLATTVATLGQAIDALARAPCVVFVNVGVLFGALDLRDQFNAALQQSVVGHPNMTVYDWSAVLQAHHEWTQDAVHVQPEFRRAYADGILDAVDAHCSAS